LAIQWECDQRKQVSKSTILFVAMSDTSNAKGLKSKEAAKRVIKKTAISFGELL
jgi:hypothetical protein